jgi:hypothetical protein
MTAGGKRKPRYGFGDIVMLTACHGAAEAANLTMPHHSGNGAGALAANVHRNGPGRTDRAFEKEHRAGQAVHGGVGVLGQRRRDDKADAAQQAHDRDRAPRELGVSGLVQQPVRRQPADGVADDACKQRQGCEQADLQEGEETAFKVIKGDPKLVERCDLASRVAQLRTASDPL